MSWRQASHCSTGVPQPGKGQETEVPLGELVKAGPWLRRCWVKSQTKGWVLKGQ